MMASFDQVNKSSRQVQFTFVSSRRRSEMIDYLTSFNFTEKGDYCFISDEDKQWASHFEIAANPETLVYHQIKLVDHFKGEVNAGTLWKKIEEYIKPLLIITQRYP
jgi:hypothetical protein